ncbi:MAG: hypothetical protein K2J00_07990 [Bacteroidaceae bacterium]|nr:hypothetical protein [Bacteroidaceae bacterium]
MKKSIILCGAVLLMAASCTTITKTSTTANVPQSLLSATVADLSVANERVTTRLEPSKAIQRGGMANIKRAAEAQALEEYARKTGKTADLLLEPEYVIEQRRNFIGTKVKSITVSGRPASYTGFHSLNDSVWCNRIFRSGYKDNVKHGNSGILKGLFGK